MLLYSIIYGFYHEWFNDKNGLAVLETENIHSEDEICNCSETSYINIYN